MSDLMINSENGIQATEDYKAVAIRWLESTGNLKKFNEQQKNQFIDICCAYGLNPIKKEVYGVLYSDKFNLIVGYESYIKRAERSGRLNGWGVEIIGNGNEMKAVITINRKDWDKPFIHEVYFDEYNTNQNLWKSKPKTMLKKVAIAQGFRMCFSEELGGMPYTADELPEEMTTETAPTVKVETTSNNKSETPLKNITPKAPKNEKKYTLEQANKMAEIMNSVYTNGDPIFSEEEKASYRQSLLLGDFDNAYEIAKKTYNKRNAEFAAAENQTPEEEVPLY